MFATFMNWLNEVNQEIVEAKKPKCFMYGFFTTMLSLLNQEITETKGQKISLLQFCGGCGKSINFKCSVYRNPIKLSWFRNQQQCAFNFKQVVKKEKAINALKASKRAAKGQA